MKVTHNKIVQAGNTLILGQNVEWDETNEKWVSTDHAKDSFLIEMVDSLDEEGYIVISDRYVESSIVYQSLQIPEISVKWSQKLINSWESRI